jgi:radical SAM protein with 4Fe4S-binding SPASM domain
MCDVGTADEDGTFYKNLRIDKVLHEISLETLKGVVDVVYKSNPYMSFNSTEPLLYKPLAEAIEYCVKRGLEVSVTTGGYLLPKKAEELAEAGLHRLNVSIDGAAATHNMIRGRPDSFERDLDGIEKFRIASQKRGLKSEILVNCTITNLNYKSLREFVSSVDHLPIDRINFAFMWFIDEQIAKEQNTALGHKFPVSSSCFGPDMDPRSIDTDSLYNDIEALRQHPKVHFHANFTRDELRVYFNEPEKFVRKNARCLASWFFMQILANGNVIPYTRCHNESFGNINSQHFDSIWNGEKMKRWRVFIKNKGTMPMCRRCDLAY